MNGQIIDKIQEEIEKKYHGKVLHILNGSCMLEEFKASGNIKEHWTYIPFNEAMCWGEADEVIFGEEFIKKRARSLKSTEQEYSQIVLEPLKPLAEETFDLIVMWFGEDMFCQINVVTLMGFLEQINYTGDLLLHRVCEGVDERLPEVYEVELGGSLVKYQDIICKHQMPSQELLPVTYEMVKLYLNYRDKNSEISQYIINNSEKGRRELVKTLLNTFSQYGLGDLQYEMIIEELLANAY
ncbi:MAG: hypothetical protein RR448_03640 [Niameybacter sp.]|uniref:hypothetical protein n=1 Tax=Niameybacter sp. TaxID=2033640 RepID=UPI002FCA0D0D